MIKVKEVIGGDRCHIVSLNEEETRKDAASRDAILAQLEGKLHTNVAKSLIRNQGYAWFLKAEHDAVRINLEAMERDARYDGKFVLIMIRPCPRRRWPKRTRTSGA